MRKHTNYLRVIKRLMLSMAIVAAMAGPSFAVEYDLKADFVTKTMPDGTQVVMWGFGLLADAEVSVPGPLLVVPPGDNVLTINLTNNLAVPVSIVIPGQPSALSPVRITDAEGRSRARSLTHETAPGATATYSWTSFRPGTFVYHSGSQPGLEVPMGLYGGAKKDSAAGQAYAGVAYDNEVIVIMSEVDPLLHQAVADGTYGTAIYPSTVEFAPSYFLVNGKPFSGNELDPWAEPIVDHPIGIAENVLIRFINAGVMTHIPILDRKRLQLVAEDGNLYPAPRDEQSILLPAMKTHDAIMSPTPRGTYALYDRSLHLTGGGIGDRGMLVHLRVGAPTAVADAYAIDEDLTLTVAAPGVLVNDTGSAPLEARLVSNTQHGTLALLADGSFSYQPAADYFGPDSFTYRADDGVLSDLATVSITVNPINDAPVAMRDVGVSRRGAPVVINVSANDTDVDSALNLASIAITQAPVRGGTAVANPDGTITFTPRFRMRGMDYFSYQISDTEGLPSNPVRVIVRVLR